MFDGDSVGNVWSSTSYSDFEILAVHVVATCEFAACIVATPAFAMLMSVFVTPVSAHIHAACVFAAHMFVRAVGSSGPYKNSRWRSPSANKDISAQLFFCWFSQPE